jgi:hypothetical protein
VDVDEEKRLVSVACVPGRLGQIIQFCCETTISSDMSHCYGEGQVCGKQHNKCIMTGNNFFYFCEVIQLISSHRQ